MNFKTTGLLLLALVLFGMLYLFFTPKAEDSVAPAQPPFAAASATAQPVIEPKLGDVTRIVAKVEGEEWVFEKTSDSATPSPAWKMTKPLDINVQGFEVDRIARQLTNLQYEVAFEPGAPGSVSASQAGLDPVETVVTLTDAEGKSAAVEIGRAASSSETYVRLSGKPRIMVGNTSLRTMLKPRAIEYRDPQLWNLASDKVTRVDIVDRSGAAPTEYRFIRDGARWMIESPVAARATGKVDEMLQAVSRLRVTKWEDNRAERLLAYGLEPAALTVRLTVEEEVPAEPAQEAAPAETAEGEPAPAKTVKKQTVHELHVSSVSPVGEDTKTFVRVGGENAVASILKTTTEKLRPILAEWRDMHVLSGGATSATQIEYATPSGSAQLMKKPDGWYFEGAENPARADDALVNAFLQQIQDLQATAFVDESMELLAAAGFNRPVADIKLTIPGQDGSERLTIGGFTEGQTRHLRFVRRNDSKSIAKVKADAVASLLAGPLNLRDRTIMSLPADALTRLDFSLAHPCGAGRLIFEVTRGENGWRMTKPVTAPLREDRMQALLTRLSSLSALAVASEDGELSPFGLNEPAVEIKLTHGDPAATVTLLAAAHDGKYYAYRPDRPMVYELEADAYQALFDELRPAEVLRLDTAAVESFSLTREGQTHTFTRSGPKWIYAAEPDLPLAATKVENLLLQVHDLKTDRFTAYVEDETEDFMPPEATLIVAVRSKGGSEQNLFSYAKTCESPVGAGHYSTSSDVPGVFLLTADMLNRLQVDLKNLE